MADGSRSAVLEAEAPAPARKARRPGRKAGWAEFIVDVWITNFHSVKFGFYKHSRNQAKSRQFTSDMDIFAEATRVDRGGAGTCQPRDGSGGRSGVVLRGRL
jgi:hypothetical protein